MERKKPLFSVVIKEKALDEKVVKIGRSALEDENPKLLKEFKALATSNMVEFWDDKKDIQLAIFKTLSDFIYRKELVGWIRGDNNINTALLAEEIAKLTSENSELREKLQLLPSQNQALYFGLEYEQLADMLKRKMVLYDGEEITLLKFLSNHGETLMTGVYTSYSSEEYPIFEELIKFKIVYSKGGLKYSFTTEGHNFYLKVIYITKTALIFDAYTK